MPISQDDVVVVTISQYAENELCLFMRLGKDGSVSRMGGIEPSDRMFVGQTDEPLFQQFMERVPDELLSSLDGEHIMEQIVPGEHKGEPLELRFHFLLADGWETGVTFLYGSETRVPPHWMRGLACDANALTHWWVRQNFPNKERRRLHQPEPPEFPQWEADVEFSLTNRYP